MIFQEMFSPVDEMPELTEDQARKMREKYEAEGSQLPPIERPEPGFWSGMDEGIYRGTASGALKSMSFAETAIANTGLAQSARNMAQVETGETFDQIDVSDVQQRLERDAKQYREIAKRDFAADPSTMGTAAQILYGVFETIPKAVAYSTIAGPAGGSVLFGADLGVSRAQELMDEGVDQNTATWAGIATFGMSALGMRVPAVFGKSRIASATIGAAVNAGLTAAETQSVNWILQNQNYTELAERYRLNPIDLITSAVFGGVMGGVLWRARPDVSANQAETNTRPALNDHLYNQLRKASPAHITDEQVRYQADLHAVGIGALASKADIDPYAIAPEIVAGEASGFSQRIPAFKPEQDLVSGIKDYFGTTWDARESGYMMQDGEMLNMSGVHEVNDERIKRDLRGRRVVDHRDVSGTNIRGVSTEQFFENQNIQNQSDYMYNFMARTGAMRMDYASSIAALTRQPTRAQLQMMQRMAYENDGLIVSYYTPDGRIVDEAEWEGPVTQKKLREFFKQAQEKADSGVSGAFAQRAWHGSPHTFERFSTDSIGSGVGAQAHGWGLYFTKDKLVANRYREDLIHRRGQSHRRLFYKDRMSDEYDGAVKKVLKDFEKNYQDEFINIQSVHNDLISMYKERFQNGNRLAGLYDGLLNMIDENPKMSISTFLKSAPAGEETRIQYAVEQAKRNAKGENRRTTIRDVRSVLEDSFKRFDAFRNENKAKLDALSQINTDDLVLEERKGRLFEVDIPDESEMLDENLLWGAGHNFELKQKIKDMIRDWNITNPDNPIYKYPDNPTGKDIYKAVAEVVGGPKAASLWFNERGIKGITYDGLRDGRCYVVFDDKAIQTIDFYQRQNSQTTAEQKLQKDVVAWNKLIDELEAVPKQTVLMLNQTPLVMHLVGADFKKLYATPHMFERLFKSKDGSKGSFGKNELKQIPQALTDPIAIFDQDNGRKLFLLDLQTSNGSPVVVPVEFNAQKDFATVNLALTAFAKEKNGKPKFGWIKNLKGKELYVNTKKLTSLNTSAGADSLGVLSERSIKDGADNSSVTKNVLTEDDLVKEREKYPGMYQGVRGSFNPSLNRITLTANADISTFSHEMGHFYLTDMFELSKLPAAANSTLKEDVDILLKEWGIKSLKEWDELGVEGQRKYHEQFASWVEEYLSKGRSPVEKLQRLFERMAQWICDVYRSSSLSKRYKDEFGIELPKPSEDVQKVLDRLFREDAKIQKSKQAVNKTQVAAARMVQANRTNENRLNELLALPEGPKKIKLLKDKMQSLRAQEKLLQQILRGQSPDVYEEVKDIDFDSGAMKEARGNFGRAYMMGDNNTAVILQNRDRSDASSIAQMNAIAANPQYGLVSVSRSYSGAPVISYGSVPDNSHLGNHDFIVETNGNRIPFMYAVVEAGEVETSNFIDGGTNQQYGKPQRMNAVVGNGRMTALKEAYRRGTASEYRKELEGDKAHGIDSEVIKGMENPVLVRVINPEDVTTGFISRSNGEQVLARDDVEIAFEDAPKIRARAGQYEFDEAGNPTRDTLSMFIQDLNDTNALGRLITSDGRPTPEAVRRIRNAVFFEAYQSPELSALFSQEVDPGIRRILNGMANVAPRIIELREEAQQLDFSGLLVEAANRIRQARLNPDEGADFAAQMSFLDNPATSAFVEFLDDNANSAAAIARTLNPLVDWARNAARAADGDGLFGGDDVVRVDLADVVGQLRNIVNEDRLARNLESLPDIDVEAIRSAINAANDAASRAVEAASPVRARMEAQQAIDSEVAAQGEDALAVKRDLSEQVLNPETQQEAMMNLFADQVPDREYTVLDDLGREKQGTAKQLLAEAELGVIKAQQDRLGLGRGVECLIRNRGI